MAYKMRCLLNYYKFKNDGHKLAFKGWRPESKLFKCV